MCIADEYIYDCVKCKRITEGRMVIDTYCRTKEEVEQMRGRFVVPDTNKLIIFPADPQKIKYFDGGWGHLIDDHRVDASQENDEDNVIIHHRYFTVDSLYGGITFCDACRAVKRTRDVGVAKRLHRCMDRVYNAGTKTAGVRGEAVADKAASDKEGAAKTIEAEAANKSAADEAGEAGYDSNARTGNDANDGDANDKTDNEYRPPSPRAYASIGSSRSRQQCTFM